MTVPIKPEGVPDRPSPPAREQGSPNELLDRLLAALEVEVDAFAICEVSPGWRLAFDPAEARMPAFHSRDEVMP